MRTNITYLLIPLALLGCKKEEFDVQNLNGGVITVLGHGGSGIHSLYPLDSPGSISACLYTGADGSEIDVQMTLDSVLVAFHDETLDASTSGTGRVSERTWEELTAVRYTNLPYQEERILRLDHYFASASFTQDKQFTFDVKFYAGSGDPQAYTGVFLRSLIRLLDSAGLAGRAFVESQDPVFLARLKEERPDIRSYIYPATFGQGLQVADELGLFGITVDTDQCTPEQIAEAHAHGRWVTLWGVYSKDDNEAAIRKNPDHIQTDRIEHLVRLLD